MIAYRMLGSVAEAEDVVIGVWALEIAGGRVESLSAIINPDKLRHIGPVADLRALLERRDR